MRTATFRSCWLLLHVFALARCVDDNSQQSGISKPRGLPVLITTTATPLSSLNTDIDPNDPGEFGGLSFIEGDILPDLSVKKSAVRASFLWNDAVVPYDDSQLAENLKSKFRDVIQDFHEHTCIRLVPVEDQKDYIVVRSNVGCSSHVGRLGGPQVLNLSYRCFLRRGTLLHELMHTMGFHHEHMRPDRDDYVTVIWPNILPDYLRNFEIKHHSDTLELPYDYRSLLHYPANAYSINNSQTIRPRHEPPSIIGQRVGFSQGDIDKLNTLYRCGKLSQWSAWSGCSLTCGRGTKVRHRSCPGQAFRCENQRIRDEAECAVQKCNGSSSATGAWSHWTGWSQCRGQCPDGERTRIRFCLPNGACAGKPIERSSCVLDQCAGDQWTAWSDWSVCSVTCAPAAAATAAAVQQQTRRRACLRTTGGCSEPSSETRPCAVAPCWSDWSVWAACSQSCGNGIRRRFRHCHHGNTVECPGVAMETGQCSGVSCTRGHWLAWGDWSQCQFSCGEGISYRIRVCSTGNYSHCRGDSATMRRCNLGSCEQVWADWSEWSACNASCGTGVRRRSRVCPRSGACTGADRQQEWCSGAACHDEENENCDDQLSMCDLWMRGGACDHPLHRDSMQFYCRRSCRLCRSRVLETADAVQPTCVDVNVNCPAWAQTGYCVQSTYQDFMRKNCAKSCNTCSRR